MKSTIAAQPDLRVAALRRFAIAITTLNVLGHTVLGLETSLAQVAVAVGTAYAAETLLELIGAWSERRRPAFIAGPLAVMDFLLPAHITGLAISMLLYGGDRILPFVFAATMAITSKTLLVAPVGNRSRHFLNPSNTGLVATILLFPSIAVAPGYHFAEDISGGWDWALPGLMICTGTLLNWRFTRKLPLIVAWVAAFLAQAYVRHLVFGTWVLASFGPVTGVAFLLFTFYMVTDPGTTPVTTRGQMAFGAAVGITYGILMAFHVVYAVFIALFLVCSARGLLLHALMLRRAAVSPAAVPALATAPPESGRPVGVRP